MDKHRDLSLNPRTYMKRLGVVAWICSSREREAGQVHRWDLWLDHGQQPGAVSILQEWWQSLWKAWLAVKCGHEPLYKEVGVARAPSVMVMGNVRRGWCRVSGCPR